MKEVFFTPARLKEFSAMVDNGLSASRIAQKFGISRNHVLSKASKLGLKLGVGRNKATPNVLPLTESIHDAINLVDATHFQCRWVYSGQRCCGKSVSQGSFCDEHRKRVYIQSLTNTQNA